jgi:hypothetical protein
MSEAASQALGSAQPAAAHDTHDAASQPTSIKVPVSTRGGWQSRGLPRRQASAEVDPAWPPVRSPAGVALHLPGVQCGRGPAPRAPDERRASWGC